MSCLSVGLLSYLLVRDEWTMMIPAAIGGVAHAFIFPAAVSGGSLAFPLRYRGLATTLILMMFDIGSLIGQPAVGTIIHAARQAGWPPYPTMFVTVSLFVGLMAIWFAIGSRRRAHAAAKLNRGL